MSRPDPRRVAGHAVLAVFAHPDDESLVCGGTLARCADAGARVSLVCTTAGAAGSNRTMTARAIADLRRAELQDAAHRLGIESVTVLDHEDGNLRSVSPGILCRDVLTAIADARPDLVITFGADGLYWHPDHIVVHEAVTEAVSRLVTDRPVLLYVTLAQGAMRRVLEAAARRGAPPDVSLWGLEADAFGAHARPATLEVDVRAYAPRKLAALRCHRTQVDERHPCWWMTDQDAIDSLGMEWFHPAGVGSVASTWLDEWLPER